MQSRDNLDNAHTIETARTASKLRPYVLLFLAVFALFIGGLELWARLKEYKDLYFNRQVGSYKALLELEPFPQSQAHLEDLRVLGQAHLKYYDYFLYAMDPVDLPTAGFTDYFSSRRVPASLPIGQGDLTIWLFGGSTMQNLETTDDLSIANQLAVSLKETGINTTVVNFGAGGFQSTLERIKFQDLLRRVDGKERPDIAIFYDGFNDGGNALYFGAGQLQTDVGRKFQALVERKTSLLTIYSASNMIGQFSSFWKYEVAPRLDNKLFGAAGFNSSLANIYKAVETYELNTRMIRAVCREFEITPLFLLQPMLHTKADLTSFEQKRYNSYPKEWIEFMKRYYNIPKEVMQRYSDFYDLSSSLDHSKGSDFYDIGHTSPRTGATIARSIVDIIRRLQLRTTSR